MPGQRRIDIPDAAADARLNNEPHETDFVAYPSRLSELAFLAEGLLPI